MIEIEQFGLNAITITFIISASVAFLEAWGLWQQNMTLWCYPEKKGQSLSVCWFCYIAAAFVISAFYGLSKKSLNLTFCGALLAILHIPILVGLWKIKGFKKAEKIFALFLFLLVLATAIPSTVLRSFMFLAFSIPTAIVLATQPYEIWKNKNSGVVEINLLRTYFLGGLTWVGYSLAVGDPILIIVNFLNMAVILVTVVFYYKYKTVNSNIAPLA